MASSVRPRGYHNTSLLLPDGRILLAGSGRLDGSLMTPEKTAEIFSPPYLHKGPRPTITSAPSTMSYGGKIDVETPDAAAITKVSLVRIGSVTHNFNMDQRWQQLNFRRSAASSRSMRRPPRTSRLRASTTSSCSTLTASRPRRRSSASTRPTGHRRAVGRSTASARPGQPARVTLNWNAATDNVGVARYAVHRSTTAGFTPSAATRIAYGDRRHDLRRHRPRARHLSLPRRRRGRRRQRGRPVDRGVRRPPPATRRRRPSRSPRPPPGRSRGAS